MPGALLRQTGPTLTHSNRALNLSAARYDLCRSDDARVPAGVRHPSELATFVVHEVHEKFRSQTHELFSLRTDL